MHQIKMFKGVESDMNGLEREINHWLKESGVKVDQVFGNMAPQSTGSGKAALGRTFDASDVFMVIVYNES